LAQRRVALAEAAVELRDDRERLLVAPDELPSDLVGVATERIDVESRERLGVLRCDLFDLDAALPREHEQRLLRAAVERDREVVLRRDFGRALDPHLPDDVAANIEAEDLGRLVLRVYGIGRELDAAGLAAAARQDLCLDDDLAAELLRRGACFCRRRR